MGYSQRTKRTASLGLAVCVGLVGGQLFLSKPAPTPRPKAPPKQHSVLTEVGQADISYNVVVGKNGYTVSGFIITSKERVPYTVYIPKSLNGKAMIRTAK